MQRLRTRLRAGASTFPSATFALNFLTGGLDPAVTFTRGSNATLVDSTGKITYAPSNLLTYSEQFDNAAWPKNGSTVTANTTVAPDGTSTADTIEATVGGAGAPRVYQRPAITGTTTYTISSYFKASGTNFAFLSMRTNSVNWAGAEFNLSTGTVSRNAVSGNVAYVGATISSAGDGWYRCTVTVTPTDTIAANLGFIFFGSSDGTSAFVGGYPSFTNVGTESIFIWGAQLEPVTYQTTPSTYVATTTAAYYGPRFDYDPVTLAAKGLLIEEQRTNLLTYSEQFDNASWIKSNSTVTANATTSPDGTVDADKLVENTANAQHFVLQLPSATASTAYTFTVYLKAAERTRAALIDSGGSSATGVFDLSSGAVVSTSNCTASVSSSGNGWYRCAITFTSAVGQTGVNARVFLVNTGTNTTYTGDGVSGIFVYGAQLEAGAFATSYIPTVASQVTRSADVATMTGTNFSSWYNQSEGTFALEASAIFPSNLLNTYNALTASDGTANNCNRISAYSNFWSLDTRTGNVGQAQLFTVGTYTQNAIGKTTYAYKTNDFAGSINGGAALTDPSGTVPTVLNRLDIGAGFGVYLNGHIRQIAYYNTRLPNATLQALTA